MSKKTAQDRLDDLKKEKEELDRSFSKYSLSEFRHLYDDWKLRRDYVRAELQAQMNKEAFLKSVGQKSLLDHLADLEREKQKLNELFYQYPSNELRILYDDWSMIRDELIDRHRAEVQAERDRQAEEFVREFFAPEESDVEDYYELFNP